MNNTFWLHWTDGTNKYIEECLSFYWDDGGTVTFYTARRNAIVFNAFDVFGGHPPPRTMLAFCVGFRSDAYYTSGSVPFQWTPAGTAGRTRNEFTILRNVVGIDREDKAMQIAKRRLENTLTGFPAGEEE